LLLEAGSRNASLLMLPMARTFRASNHPDSRVATWLSAQGTVSDSPTEDRQSRAADVG
jgi:hypothetical protein